VYLRCTNSACDFQSDRDDCCFRCPSCGDLLELAMGTLLYDAATLKRVWLARRSSRDPRDQSGVWRFREFLPNDYTPAQVVTMGEGNIPLLPAYQGAAWTGCRGLHYKHLGWNPTGCFKDLGMTIGMTEAVRQGARTVACASTGNTAASMAAYAARAGLQAEVYLPAGTVSANKLAQTLDYGARIVEVEGNFDQALARLLENGGKGTYFLNSINPFRIEGQKTVMFELLEQLDWHVPDFVVLPGGNLGNVSAFGKALQELQQTGFIVKLPRLVVVQAEGANPLVRTWKARADELETIDEPETAATAIRIGKPMSWKKALRALKLTNGLALDVSEDEIRDAKAVVGRDGIGCEPASATTLAAVRKLVAQGIVSPDAVVVAVLTGHVLKDTEYILHPNRAAAEATCSLRCETSWQS